MSHSKGELHSPYHRIYQLLEVEIEKRKRKGAGVCSLVLHSEKSVSNTVVQVQDWQTGIS